MKKRTARMISVFLTLILFILAGCAGNESGNPASGNDGGGAQSSGGETTGGSSGKLLDKPLTLKAVAGGTNINAKAPVFDHIFEKTNVRLEVEYVSTNYDQRAQTMIATNNLPDIMLIKNSAPYFAEAAKNGMFLPVSDYLDYAPNLSRIMKENKEIAKNKVGGILYSFPQLGHWKLQLAQAPMMRVDLLEELGLEKPKTFEDLYNILKKFKEAYPDKIPFTARESAKNVLGPLAFAMGSGNRIYFDPDVDGGKYLYGPMYPEFKKPLEFLHRLYVEKLFDPDYAVNTSDGMKEKLASGKALFYYDNNSFGVNFNAALKPVNPKARFDLLPLMQNDRGQTRNWMYSKDWMHHFVINAKTKYPRETVKFLDWMYSEEGTIIMNYGAEGIDFDMVNGKPVIKESVIEKFKNSKDPYRDMQAALGVGFQAFTPNVDETPMAIVSDPDLVRWAEQIIPENGYVYSMTPPPFTEQEVERLKTLQSKVDTLMDQEMDKFIIGTRPMSDYDNLIRQLKDSGAQEIEDIYNEAYQRFLNEN